jgi:hypothetical protein
MARVAMDYLKFHPGSPCPIFLRPTGGPSLKLPYGRFRSGPSAGQVTCGRLLPLLTPHAVRLCPHNQHTYWFQPSEPCGFGLWVAIRATWIQERRGRPPRGVALARSLSKSRDVGTRRTGRGRVLEGMARVANEGGGQGRGRQAGGGRGRGSAPASR